MVLSAAVVGIVLPTMVLIRREKLLSRLGALTLGVAWMLLAYAVTNPYVPVNLLRDAPQLASNLANTRAMYGQAALADGLSTGAARLLEAASPLVLALAGVALVVGTIGQVSRLAELSTRRLADTPIALLLAAPSVIVLAQFFALAGGKPSEYARFAIFPTIVLAIAGVSVIARLPWHVPRAGALLATPALLTWLWTWPYVTAFLDDAQTGGTRFAAAERLRALPYEGLDQLQVFADPAPYTLPPLDLWRWEITLTPADHDPIGDVILRPTDDPAHRPKPPAGYRREVISSGSAAPITWANKPFELLIREPTTRR
jgi:hypothetical protein